MRRKALTGAAGIVIALVIGALIMLAEGFHPLATYQALFQFSLFGLSPLATTIRNSVPLVLAGLSASIAFASGAVNLGQPGQLVVGALCATVAGLALHLPAGLEIPALVLAATAGGLLWSGCAALLRRAFGMSEFIVTLMLNMIADFFTAWVIAFPLLDPRAYSPMTRAISTSGWLPDFGGFSTTILFMLAAAAVSWFVFQRSKAGYEWRLSGQNSLFARLGGCSIDRNFVAVMLFTGALAGLAGGLVVMAGPAPLHQGPRRQLRVGRRDDRNRGQQRAGRNPALRPVLQLHPDRRPGNGADHERSQRDCRGPAGRARAGDRGGTQIPWSGAGQAGGAPARLGAQGAGKTAGRRQRGQRRECHSRADQWHLSGATPILLAALGGTFTYYAGVFNIAMEGMMLTGAFGAVVGSWFFHSWPVGIAFAIAFSVLMAVIFIIFAVVLQADEFVTGIALNLFAVGATTYLLRQTFAVKGVFANPAIVPIPRLDIPLVDRVPFLGQILSGQNLVIYVAVLSVFLTAYLVFGTRFGLRLRAAGFNGACLDSSGVSTARIRVSSLLLCGVFCGVAGAFLSLGYVQLFQENMSADGLDLPCRHHPCQRQPVGNRPDLHCVRVSSTGWACSCRATLSRRNSPPWFPISRPWQPCTCIRSGKRERHDRKTAQSMGNKPGTAPLRNSARPPGECKQMVHEQHGLSHGGRSDGTVLERTGARLGAGRFPTWRWWSPWPIAASI